MQLINRLIALFVMGAVQFSLYAEVTWTEGVAHELSARTSRTTEELMAQEEFVMQVLQEAQSVHQKESTFNGIDRISLLEHVNISGAAQAYFANQNAPLATSRFFRGRHHHSSSSSSSLITEETKNLLFPFQFTAVTFNDTQGLTPPDTMGAVGPTQYIAFCNGRLRSFHKTPPGLPDGGIDIAPEVFFGPPLLPLGIMADPRIRYDRELDCWFLVMMDTNSNTNVTPAGNNNIHIAVSDTGTISKLTNWKFFTFNPGVLAGAQASVYFADQPTLGIDSHSLYIGTNIFRGTNFSTEADVFILNKRDLFNTGTAPVFVFHNNPFGMQGADVFDPNNAFGFFVSANKLAFGLILDVFLVSYVNNIPLLSNDIPVEVQPFRRPLSEIPQPPDAFGQVILLDSLDNRLCNVHVRDNQLYTSHNIGVNNLGVSSDAQDRTGSRWYQLDVSNPLAPIVIQTGTVFDSTTNRTSYWTPSVMTNGLHSLVLGCSTAGPVAFANATYLKRYSNDPLNTLSFPFVYTNATLPYKINLNLAVQRWGDYSNTSVDPNDNMTLWTIQEFANPELSTVRIPPIDGTTDNFGTEVIRIPAAPPANITSVSPSEIKSHSSKIVTVRITGQRVNGSAFYDPGPGFVNRLQVVIGDLPILAVRYISPTLIEVDVSTKNVGSGHKTITVINPDGQIISADGFFEVKRRRR